MARRRRTQKGRRYDWKHPYFDEFNTSFNPQKVINRGNVGNLKLKWACRLTPGNFGGPRHEKPKGVVQTVALVVGGAAFVADGANNVYSVDARTGKPKWTYKAPTEGATGHELIHTLNYHDGLVYMLSSNCVLYGFDPETGELKNRVFDIFPDKASGYSGRTAPSFFGDNAIVGAATTHEGTARGCVAACDIRSKNVAWRWFAVPPAVIGPKNWDAEAKKGNISAYPNDWGETDLSGRGSVWSQPVVDSQAGLVYFGTGDPGLFVEGSMMPGPLLYTNCLVSLDAKTGEMKWYFQTTPHDVLGWDTGWSTILAEVGFEGKKRKVVIAGTRGNLVYVLDAETGKPLYSPVRVGFNTEALNANLGDRADMTLSLKPGVYSPGRGGGIDAALAFADNTIFVSSQRIDQRADWRDWTYQGKPMRVIEFTNTDSPRFSTISAIDASRGEVRWSYFIPNSYQGAGLVVSGGVVYGVDGKGILYMLDAENGALIRKILLPGGASTGVSIASTKEGEMRLFVSVSARDGGPNKLLCFGLT